MVNRAILKFLFKDITEMEVIHLELLELMLLTGLCKELSLVLASGLFRTFV